MPQGAAITPGMRADFLDGERSGFGGMSQQPGGQPPSIANYLHAFRRHWLVAFVLGGILAAAAGTAAFFAIRPSYTAVAMIRVAVNEPAAWKHLAGEYRIANEYDFFRGTQQQLLKSRFVLHAALRTAGISDLDVIRDQGDSALDWLEKAIRVGAIKDSEMLTVSLSASDAEEAAKILDAVVKSYRDEVDTLESGQRRARLAELEVAVSQREEQIRRKRTELKGFVDQWGTSDAQALSIAQQVLVQHFGENRRELAQVQGEKRKILAELRSQQAVLEAYKKGKPEDLLQTDFIGALANDPIYRQALTDLSAIQRDNAMTESVAMGPLANKYNNNVSGLQTSMQTQLELRRKEVLTQVLQANKAKATIDVTRLQTELDSIQAEETRLKAEVTKLRDQTEKIGAGTIDVEMLRGEIKQLETVFGSIVDQREKLKVELKSESRITVVPTSEEPLRSNILIRVALSGLAAIAAMCLPGVCLVLWDVQTKRVNTAKQTGQEAGVDVVGTMPVLPSNVIRRLGAPSGKNQFWRALVTESVDGISARVLHGAKCDDTHVLMISSAEAKEGKTTLASQLAMSLARLGHRTLLVDFDIRHAMIHRVFGVDAVPGIGEVLRGQADVQDAIKPTANEGLYVMPAGTWDRTALGLLTGDDLGKMFQRLRAEFEFVIVDGSPVLPVPDARFVCRHVDGVVLSVLRDVSRIPRIQAASDLLAALGTRVLGAVVSEPALVAQSAGFRSQVATAK
jgi:capsular exopolysaccharide synthesis family protein